MLDRRRTAGTRIVLDSPADLEMALRLFRDDTLAAKSEARRKRHFVSPAEKRKLKAVAARKRTARARRKQQAATR